MGTIVWMILPVATAAGAPPPATEPTRIDVHIDHRVELMSLIFRLAGHPEYNHRLTKGPYIDRIEKHFGQYRNHPVVQTARRLRSKRGVSFDAVMSMAVHIDRVPGLKERIPFDKRPARLDGRWRTEEARDFLVKARRFVADTSFSEFMKRERPYHKLAADRLRRRLSKRNYIDWFDSFFGAKSQTSFYMIPGLLNGPNCYGVGIRFPNGREEITPVMGLWRFDWSGNPVFGKDIVPTIVHEFCHSYTNRIVDRWAKKLEPAGRAIWPHYSRVMKRQAYGSWRTMMYESMVRACVVRYIRAVDGTSSERTEINRQHKRGFKWTGALSNLLAEYEQSRDRYETLDSFMPRIVAFFDDYARHHTELTSHAPKVVSLAPANGATDVDPDRKTITITFDQPMEAASGVISGWGPNYPKFLPGSSYDKSGKVLTLPVRLDPSRTYEFWLNRKRFKPIKNRAGVPLEPVNVTFKTRQD